MSKMSRKLATIVLTLTLLFASVVAARPVQEAAPDNEQLPVNAPSAIDQAYFNQFGPGFEFMQRSSVQIGHTFVCEDWTLEVHCGVAVVGQSFTKQVLPADFDPHSAWAAPDGMPRDFDFEEVTATLVEVYTFFSLRDMSGAVDLSDINNLGLVAHDGWAAPLHYNEETGAAYFVMRHTAQVEGSATDSVSVDFAITRVLANQVQFDEQVDIDLAALLDTHEASFHESGHTGGAVVGGSLDDFMFFMETFLANPETMALDELDIPIFGDTTLTNIALRGDTLLLQISEEDIPLVFGRGPQESWSHVSLVDSRVEPPGWDFFDDADAEDADEMQRLSDIWQDNWQRRHIHSITQVDVTPLGYDFMPTGGRRIREFSYQIEDLDVLQYLAFAVTGAYFEVVQPVDFEAATLEIPVVNRRITIDTMVVPIFAERYALRDIEITPLEIRFVIDDARPLIDSMHADVDPAQRFSATDHVQIVLFYAYSAAVEYVTSAGSWGHSMPTDNDEPMQMFVTLGGGVIDLDNLVAISFNRAMFRLDGPPARNPDGTIG